MSDEQANPRPWEVDGDHAWSDIVDANGGLVAELVSIADAKLIVRAVNAHEELVAALKDAIRCIEASTVRAISADGMNALYAALAKAEGK